MRWAAGGNQSTQQSPDYEGYNAWRIVAQRYDGANKYINLDRIAETSAAAVASLALTGGLTLGANVGGGNEWAGDLRCVYVFNRALSDSELLELIEYIAIDSASLSTGFFIAEGDSITAGYEMPVADSWPSQMLSSLGGAGSNWYHQNLAVSGEKLTDMITDGATEVDEKWIQHRLRNILIVFGGTNDIVNGATGTEAYELLVTYCLARRAAYPLVKIIVCTMLPRIQFDATMETYRETFNTNVRNNFASFSDKVADVAADSRLDDYSDTTYYNVDGIHTNAAGNLVIADLVEAKLVTL
jgi:lysophospholipase L1-like esterase